VHVACVHVQLWGGNSSQRKELQSYLIRELNLNFEVSWQLSLHTTTNNKVTWIP
jgi:hypothetical protein